MKREAKLQPADIEGFNGIFKTRQANRVISTYNLPSRKISTHNRNAGECWVVALHDTLYTFAHLDTALVAGRALRMSWEVSAYAVHRAYLDTECQPESDAEWPGDWTVLFVDRSEHYDRRSGEKDVMRKWVEKVQEGSSQI